ncbi:MAG TPA: MBL fold metallo-hydrolase [Bacteroidota bacterium]
MITVRFWGTRGSIATPGPKTLKYGGNTSCVEVRVKNHILVFDAGTGIRELGIRLLEEFKSKPISLHLFISHTHWDHIQGFPFFLPAYDKRNKISIYGPPGHDKPFQKILRIQMDSEYFPVSLGDMSPEIHIVEMNEPLKLPGVTVEPFSLNHPGMTLAFRVSDGKHSVVYATDNEPYRYTLHQHTKKKQEDLGQFLDEKFIDFLQETDLYIGEAQYTLDEYKQKLGWGHSPIESVAEWAVRANVERLALFHHDPLHNDAMVDKMVKHAGNLIKNMRGKSKCFGAREGMVIKIG